MTALKLPLGEKLWFLALFPLSGLVRLVVIALPYRIWSRALGRPQEEDAAASAASPKQQRSARQIGRACRLVSKYTPWECKCLVQSLAARLALSALKVPHRLFIGVMRDATNASSIKAHAWVEVGPCVITGQEGHKSFTVLATYRSRASGEEPASGLRPRLDSR